MKIIRNLVNFYARLPLRPFFKILKKIYSGYKILDMKIKKWQGIDYRNVLAVREGIKYILDLSEEIDSAIYHRSYFEPLVRRIINKFVKPDMIVFDIGANIGCHTFYLAKLVGQKGKVIAFEPMLRPFLRIKRNKELNNFNNIILEKIALSDINQKKQLVFFQSSYPFIKIGSPPKK